MENPGETLVGDYLRFALECEFVDYNVYTSAVQGEIDVVGINNSKKNVYICEVITHLTTGMQYVKDKRPDTGPRLIRKFLKNIIYAEENFKDFERHYMIWSPVVKHSNGKEQYNQFSHLEQAIKSLKKQTGVTVKQIINREYVAAIDRLREIASKETKELKSPIMRFLQIEHYAKRNINKLTN